MSRYRPGTTRRGVKRRPLLAAAILSCCFLGLFLQVEIEQSMALGITLLSLISIALLRLGGHRSTMRSLLILALSGALYVKADIPPVADSNRTVAVPCRVEGTVISTTARSWGSTMKVRGQIKIRGVPQYAGTVLISSYGQGRVSILDDSKVIIYGRCERPIPVPFTELFDASRWAYSSASGGVLVKADSRNVHVLELPRIAFRLRSKVIADLQSVLQRCLNDESAPIMSAMILGQQHSIDRDIRSLFSSMGTAHILAVSGTHVSILTGILLGILGSVSIKRRGLVLIGGLLTSYAFLTGADPPAIRAVAVFLLYGIGRIMGKEPDTLNLLGAVTMGEIVFDPTLIVSASFQLSALATFAIIVLSKSWMETFKLCGVRWTPVRRICLSLAALNLSASTGVALPVALLFGSVAYLSPLTNAVIIPILTASFLAGLLTLGLGLTMTVLASIPAWIVEIGIQVSLHLMTLLEEIQIPVQADKAPLVGLLLVLAMLWPLVSTTWRSLLCRITCSMLVLAGVHLFVDREPPNIQSAFSSGGIATRVHVNERTRIIEIGERNGRAFVRSLYDSRTNN